MLMARTQFARVKSAIRLASASGAALLALSTAPLAADVKTGVDAWSKGDFTRAVSEWQAPAQAGDADALFNLAQAYRLGRGVPADITRARELYAEAAQKGHVKAADNYGLLLFQQGQQSEAMPLIKDAAERGDPRAQYVMGLSHFNGDYAQKDWPRAYAFLTLAQSAGLPQAKPALSQMDQFIPMEQRQQAQLLARQLEAEAGKRRAAELAAVDLVQRGPAGAAAPARLPAPTPVVIAQTPASAPIVSEPAPAAIAKAPFQQQSRPIVRQSASPKPPVRNAVQTPAARSGKWKVQLGAFGVRSNANRLWAKLSRYSALSGTSKELVPAGKVTRLMAKGFASRAEADAACKSLKAQGQACLVKAP